MKQFFSWRDASCTHRIAHCLDLSSLQPVHWPQGRERGAAIFVYCPFLLKDRVLQSVLR